MASAEISKSEIQDSIKDILKDADLSELTSKRVRRKLEQKYGLDFTDRKKEIDAMLMKSLDEAEKEENGTKSEPSDVDKSAEEESDLDEPEDMGPPVKKVKTSKAGKGKSGDVDDEELAKQLQEEENGGRRTRGNRKPAPKPKKPKAEKSKTEGGPKKGLYGQPCDLSPALAEVMGTNKMVRSDIVKRMWEIVNARNLKDPKNRQFMICDEQLQKVFGRKRVKTFGMMKYLSDHIFKPGELSDVLQ